MANSPKFSERTLEDFKSRLIGGGARPNLFECDIIFPTFATPEGDSAAGVNEITRFMCKAAQLPASNVAEIPVPFRGRVLKVAGDRSFDPWTITVVNDVDFRIRTAFEKWMNSINRLSDATGANNPADYQEDAYVHQLDRDGSTLRTYRFYDVFPTNISQVDLSYETVDTIEEFTVELQVLYFESIKGVGDNAGGESIS